MATLATRRGAGAAQRGSRDRLLRFLPCVAALATAVLLLGYAYFLSAAVSLGAAAPGPGAPDPPGGADGGRRPADPPRDTRSVATIGYAVTVTGCPANDGGRGDFGAGIADGAAVLKHSIHLHSARHPGSGSRYDYALYALVHPDAEACARAALAPLGYEVLLRDVPVPVAEIEGAFLRERVPKNGCCGEKEFVKLHAYALVAHPAVVHLDLDTLVLRPLDRLFDAMLGEAPADAGDGGVDVAFGDPLRPAGAGPVDAFFTRDYNMAHPGGKHVGVQGGFLVLRPSLDAYREFADIIRKGDFRQNGGWGGLGFGPFYGSMTFQGIIPYFYDHLHLGTAVELNGCVYNNMANNPRDKPTKNDVVSGRCRDGYNRPDKHDTCEDCRSRPFADVVTTHFTLCQKPWECLAQDGDRIQERLCREFHGEWYRVREDLETSVWGRERIALTDTEGVVAARGGGFQVEHFRGYCKQRGKSGYIRIDIKA